MGNHLKISPQWTNTDAGLPRERILKEKIPHRLFQCNFSLSFQTPHGANPSLENEEEFTWQGV